MLWRKLSDYLLTLLQRLALNSAANSMTFSQLCRLLECGINLFLLPFNHPLENIYNILGLNSFCFLAWGLQFNLESVAGLQGIVSLCKIVSVYVHFSGKRANNFYYSQ